MQTVWDVVVVGSGNAALCAAIAAREAGRSVLVIEAADRKMAGGNSKYTAGAMRFAYNGKEDLLPLLKSPNDPRIADTEFGTYTADKFGQDLLAFNDGRPLSPEQEILVAESYGTLRWLATHDVKFDPIFSRQSFQKDGKFVFWGGLTLEAEHEGVGLVETELAAFLQMGGEIRYECEALDLVSEKGRVVAVQVKSAAGDEVLPAKAVILACGGFEANVEMRKRLIGDDWLHAKVRGTPYNIGTGLEMAYRLGAVRYGLFDGCHATPMDLHMPNFGNLDIPHIERKNYRKICYFLGIMLNARGERFVDEGKDFRNYTYAQFGRAVLEQPGHFAWQIFDAKVAALLYQEYTTFHDAHFVESDTLDGLVARLDGIEDKASARATIDGYNAAVNRAVPFDPTIKDGKNTPGLALPKSHWAQAIDTPPFRAYPVTGGITFTYGGVKVDREGGIVDDGGRVIPGLFACGEMVGGVFFNGYPGGSGLTSGAVFGRRAGRGAAAFAAHH